MANTVRDIVCQEQTNNNNKRVSPKDSRSYNREFDTAFKR